MNPEQQLLAYFTELSNKECQNTEEITQYIENFAKAPESIFTFLNIAASNQNALFRRYALVFSRQCLLPIDRSLKQTHEEIDPNQFSYLFPLKEQILSLFLNETFELKPAVCDVIEVLASIIIQVSEWTELSKFAMGLFENPEYIQIALYFMKCIYSALPDEEQAAFFVPYSTYILQSLLLDNIKIRLNAIDCLSDLLFEFPDDDDILQIPSLIDVLKNASEKAIQNADEHECSQLFGLYEYIFTDRFTQFNEVFPSVCEFALSIISNPEIPGPIKVSVHQILDEAPHSIPEYFADIETYTNYLQASLQLSCEICAADRESTDDYQFAGTFISALAYENEEIDAFYETMLQLVQSLIESQNAVMIQVSLFALTSIIEYCSDPILENPDLILELTLQGLKSPDEILPMQANELLSSIIDYAPSCLSQHFDQLVEFYTSKLNIPQFVPTFIALLSNSDRPPASLNELIPLLMTIIGSEEVFDRHDYVKCIAASLMHASIDESYYSSLAQPLLSLISADSSLLPDVFDCFGALLKTSPVSMAADVNSIMELIFSSEQQMIGCSETLLQFVETLPVAMAPFNEHVLAFCKFVLDQETSDLLEDDIYDISNNPNLKLLTDAHGASINILAYLAPDDYYLHKVIALLKSIFPFEQLAAAESISNSAQTLSESSVDVSPIFETLFNQVEIQEQPEVFVAMIEAISDLSSFYPDFVAANAPRYIKLIISTITSQSKCFSQQNSSASVEERIMPSIYVLFDHIVENFGANFNQFLQNPLDQETPNLQSTLFNLIQGKKRNIRGFATLILSKIALTVQSPDIFQLALNSIKMNIKSNNINLRINLFNALRYILRYPETFSQSEIAQSLIEDVHGILATLIQSFTENHEAKDLIEATLALLARCIVVFRWENFDPGTIGQLLSLLDVSYESDNGKCLDIMELLTLFASDQTAFAAVAEQALKFAVRVYSQDHWYFTHTPQNILDFANSILISNGTLQESVFQLVGFNQRIYQTISTRLGL